jgi:hypothetical protein
VKLRPIERDGGGARRSCIQQLIYEQVVIAPIWQNVPLNGVGPRVARRTSL